MTQRERHTPDAALLPADHLRRHNAAHSPASEVSLWEEWYPRASPEQRQEVLARAMQQGVVYTHQLTAPARPFSIQRSLLSNLLKGSIPELEPLVLPNLTYRDGELDRTQREAVARASATPDVCLIQGFPGTGKSRLVAEIVLQAAQRGELVLLLAPNAAGVDGVLERLSTHVEVFPLRCLEAEEDTASLPPAIARLTLPERVRSHRETALPAARALRDAARRTLDADSGKQARWPQLEELVEQCEHLAERLRIANEMRSNLDGAEANLTQCSATFRERRQSCERIHAERLDRVDGQLAGLLAELETIAGKQARMESEWEAIRPLAESRQERRFWTASWWRSVLHRGLSDRIRELQARRADMQAARQSLEQDIAARRSERDALEKNYAVEIRRLLDEEIARHRAELNDEIDAVARQRESLLEQGRALYRSLADETAALDLSRQTVQLARAAWQRRHEKLAEQAESTEEWLRTVEEGVRTLPQKLADCANVVAATTATLATDAHFGDRNGSAGVLFDLLILEEAHLVTESEFVAAARRARRWVLIGEPRPDVEPASSSRKPVHSAVLRPGFFERLWRNLHIDPRRLPFAWMQRQGRLLCRLRSLAADEGKWIETETVVDRPDIELHILSMPRQTPCIVEVLFPAGMGIAEAKQFLFQEMEELAVHTHGCGLYWSETPTEVILEFDANDAAETVTVELAGGVRERLARVSASQSASRAKGIDWHTAALIFAVAEGWTRERAEAWVAERLGLRSWGRTILLSIPHRLDPPLARVLSDWLFAGQLQSKTESNSVWSRPAVEFVAVPALSHFENRSHAKAEGRTCDGETAANKGGVSVQTPRLRSVKGGAGLEMDLSDDRPLEQLPADLRSLLPREGLVNYLEARALIGRLEALFLDEDFRAACARWQRRRFSPCERGCTSSSACACPHPCRGPAVAVMALYPAQVELLRHLLQRTPLRSESAVSFEIGLPWAFAQRECLLAFVSLTRSHTHRAVSYGEHPQALVQALTRAASGLLLFGDPGTLARRSQWRGPLDHLDEAAARHEGRVVTQLVQYLQGRGPHSSSFLVREGSSV
jgi:hypothetical protein